jgi:penicillin-insensitive murein endopeptidase
MPVLPGVLWGGLTATTLGGGFGPFLDDDVILEETGEIAGELLIDDTGFSACQLGVLKEGVQLREIDGLVTLWNVDRAWGTPQLVEAIQSAAEEVRWLVPDADPLVVGDMSMERGGYFAGHKSHREGLDADIGLFSGHARQTRAFNDLDATTFDVASNWILIRAFLKTGLVDRILLDQSLIELLRDYLASTGELTAEEIDQVFPRTPHDRWNRDGILHQGIVHHATSHRNHMHLRVLCAP